MHEPTYQDPSPDAIEEMPAAPEADQGTRDADAPTWSAPTEGHPDMPLSGRRAETVVDPRTVAVAVADEAPAPAAPSPGSGVTPAEVPELITGDTIHVSQGGAQRIVGKTITVTQGGAAIIRGDQVRVQRGGAAIIAARRVDVREGGAFIILARRVSGNVNAALDWRGIAAIFVGLVALKVVRGRR